MLQNPTLQDKLYRIAFILTEKHKVINHLKRKVKHESY
jgi:hypothetical protein